jgi:hypothetical protein
VPGRCPKQHFEHRQPLSNIATLFVSSRETAMPVRTIQAVIAGLARRARLGAYAHCALVIFSP